MILISAQPDENYFIWQLRVQIDNLRRLHNPHEYHIIVRVRTPEPNPNFVRFQQELEGSQYKIFFYWDMRPDWNNYLPSLRPHVFAQHFEVHDISECFYIDSDIIFRELIDFNELPVHHYISDTISYISGQYIASKPGNLLLGMCKIVGIEPRIVLLREKHSGGAQYVMRGITHEFWKKVEKDAINLYLYMRPFSDKVRSDGIQAWTADMWAVLWNLWLTDLDCKVHPELNFCWPTQLISQWDKTKILHNAGVTPDRKDKLFYKPDFQRFNPLGWNFDYVDPKYCSKMYTNAIELTHGQLIGLTQPITS